MWAGEAGQEQELTILPFCTIQQAIAALAVSARDLPLQGMKNGVATNNVIPSSMISPIAKAMQSFLPDPTNTTALFNNYFGGYASGFDNHLTDYRVDYDVSSKHRISTLGAMGAVNYLNNYGSGTSPVPYGFLPPPYIGGDLANIYPKNYMVEDTYTFSPNLINQFKYGFTRFFQNIHNATQGVKAWEAGTMGITNLPGGQAGEEFPGAQFAPTTASGTVQTGGPRTATRFHAGDDTEQLRLTDNLQWLKGKHALTFGLTFQWQEINNANPATFTGVLSLAYNAYSTANFGSGSNALNTGLSQPAPSGFPMPVSCWARLEGRSTASRAVARHCNL